MTTELRNDDWAWGLVTSHVNVTSTLRNDKMTSKYKLYASSTNVIRVINP